MCLVRMKSEEICMKILHKGLLGILGALEVGGTIVSPREKDSGDSGAVRAFIGPDGSAVSSA